MPADLYKILQILGFYPDFLIMYLVSSYISLSLTL